MRPENNYHYLHQIANLLGDDRREQKENLLLLLREGKIIAFIDDDNISIDIPRIYWRHLTLDKFIIFKGPKGDIGREFHVHPCEAIRIAYRKALECCEQQNGSKDKAAFLLGMLADSLVDTQDESAMPDEVYQDIKNWIAHHDGSGDEGIVKQHLESLFITKIDKLPVYISGESWINYSTSYSIGNKSGSDKSKGGRLPDGEWVYVWRYVIQCAMKHHNAPDVMHLIGLDREITRIELARRLFFWLKRTRFLSDNAMPKLESFEDNLKKLELIPDDIGALFSSSGPRGNAKTTDHNKRSPYPGKSG